MKQLKLFIIRQQRKYCKHFLASTLLLCVSIVAFSQTAEEVLQKVKMKLERVNDYEANGQMKTNVAFIKAPVANIKVYYKKPNKLRIVNQNGISFIPKGSVNISANNVFANTQQYDIIDAGLDSAGLRVIRLLPKDDTADVVLSTLYVDQKSMLIKKSKTTTRENGTYELEMNYGKYADYGLPDQIIFSFNTKDYKLPKGITLDYDDGTDKNTDKLKDKKGRVVIIYSSYRINEGIDDKVFGQ